MEVTQDQFQQHEEMGGQDADTQEPIVLHLLVKATAEIQVAVDETQADVEIEIQEEVVTQEPTSSQLNAVVVEGELQGKDAVTQEPTPSELMAEVPTQAEVAEGELQKEDDVTQELASLEMIAEVPM